MNQHAVGAAVGALLTLSAGCYASAPPKLHPLPVPDVSSAALDVRSEETTAIETTHNQESACLGAGIPGLGAKACLDAEYSYDTEVEYVTSTASVNGAPISYGQFLTMTDPNYSQKMAELDEHRSACQASAIPEWAGIGLAIGGVIALSVADEGSALSTLGYVGLGAGAASYAAGYLFLGGSRCAEGQRVYTNLDHSEHKDTMAVIGENAAREMQAVADSFNARRQQMQAAKAQGHADE